jgi:hypothetical protein
MAKISKINEFGYTVFGNKKMHINNFYRFLGKKN